MHPTVADVASPFLPSIRHAKSAPPCKAKTLANAQVFRASTAEIYPLNFTKTHNFKQSAKIGGFGPDTVLLAVLPLAHNYTLGSPGALGVLARGGRVVISPSMDCETCSRWSIARALQSFPLQYR